ncbi:hypothetical protein V5738_11025 [Salinisphaera sp. SPP-AMP-43]|uniref:hypothetical protein n=1 Tax=Salinisphaera sp. SPP-AMP-43 TaxID=3121288 RepID=UPI003C6E3CA9
MQFTVSIDQTRVLEWGLSCSEAVLFAFIYTLPSWAESRVIDGVTHSYVTKQKILRELPMLTDKPDTVYRHLKSLRDKGLVTMTRQEGAMFVAVTSKGQAWNRVQAPTGDGSDKNPNLGNKSEPRKNLRDASEKNPNHLGNISDISVYQGSDNQLSEQSSSGDDASADADLLGDEPMPIAASRSSKPEPVSDQAIVDLYHEMLPELPRVAKLTDKRKTWIEARRNDHPDHRSIEFWRGYFEIVQRSPHLLGNNDRGWTANFEWLVNSSNFVKTIEGQYLRPEGESNGQANGHHGQGRGESLNVRLAKRGRQAKAEREAREAAEAGYER